MTRLTPIDPSTASGPAKALLDGVQSALGMTPNLMRTLAHSPAALEGYLNFNGALARGSISPQLREQIAIAIAEANGCDYCLSAHTMLGKMAKVDVEALENARSAKSTDAKVQAALTFARRVLDAKGRVSDQDLSDVRDAGFSEGEIAEIVGHVGLNVFTNYFNNMAETEIDFPPVRALSVR